jgi:hypothetical protein
MSTAACVAIVSTDAAAPPCPVAVGGPDPLPTCAVAGTPKTSARATRKAAGKPLKRIEIPLQSFGRDPNKRGTELRTAGNRYIVLS